MLLPGPQMLFAENVMKNCFKAERLKITEMIV